MLVDEEGQPSKSPASSARYTFGSPGIVFRPGYWDDPQADQGRPRRSAQPCSGQTVSARVTSAIEGRMASFTSGRMDSKSRSGQPGPSREPERRSTQAPGVAAATAPPLPRPDEKWPWPHRRHGSRIPPPTERICAGPRVVPAGSHGSRQDRYPTRASARPGTGRLDRLRAGRPFHVALAGSW